MTKPPSHTTEINSRERFEFGVNWTRFLAVLTKKHIGKSEQSLKEMLGTTTLNEKTFLDIGSGSGLSSLAARRLGAKVFSFDYDPQSVACTNELKRRYFKDDPDWQVEEGSALDIDYIGSLGKFDIVYSWGVLHHTGSMWEALENATIPVREGGQLFIAIYNDQGWRSRFWLAIKRTYNALPRALRFLVLWPTFARLWGPTTIRDLIKLQPFSTWRTYGETRGMSPWHDVVDWVGGLPFEVATHESMISFFTSRGYSIQKSTTCGGGIGCNEFIFKNER